MTWGEFKAAVEEKLHQRVPLRAQDGNHDACRIGIIDMDCRPSGAREDYVYIGITDREQQDGQEFNITNGILQA